MFAIVSCNVCSNIYIYIYIYIYVYTYIYIFYVERFTEVVAPKCSVKKTDQCAFSIPPENENLWFSDVFRGFRNGTLV